MSYFLHVLNNPNQSQYFCYFAAFILEYVNMHPNTSMLLFVIHVLRFWMGICFFKTDVIIRRYTRYTKKKTCPCGRNIILVYCEALNNRQIYNEITHVPNTNPVLFCAITVELSTV